MANNKLNIIIHRYDTPTRYVDGANVEWRVSLKQESGAIANTGREFSERRDALNYADGVAMALHTLDRFGTVVTELVTKVDRNRYVYSPIEL